MSEYPKQYGKAIKYNRENWELFRKRFKEEPHHLWGGPGADHTVRRIAADAYEEATGDTGKANLLRNDHQHVVLVDGHPQRGRFTAEHVDRALVRVGQALEDLANHESHIGHWYDKLRVEPGGMVRVSRFTTPRITRNENGNGTLSFPDVSARSEVKSVHATQVGNHLADDIEAALDADLGWNRDWQHSMYDSGLWADGNKRVRDRLQELRNAPVEEVVPESPDED